MRERHCQLQLQQAPLAAPQNGNGNRGHSVPLPQQQRQQQLPPHPPAVLLCGDLNTTPRSDTVDAIKRHALGLRSIWDAPWCASAGASNSGGGAPSNGRGNGGRANGNGKPQPAAADPQQLANEGQQQQNGSGQPPAAAEGAEFTTWKFRSSGVAQRTIDYVFYSGAQLAPVSRWRMLSEEEIGPLGLPSAAYPSDHVAVTACLGWLPSSDCAPDKE